MESCSPVPWLFLRFFYFFFHLSCRPGLPPPPPLTCSQGPPRDIVRTRSLLCVLLGCPERPDALPFRAGSCRVSGFRAAEFREAFLESRVPLLSGSSPFSSTIDAYFIC